MNPASFQQDFLNKVLGCAELNRKYQCLLSQFTNLTENDPSTFRKPICWLCKTDVLNYNPVVSTLRAYYYFKECDDCGRAFCNFKDSKYDEPDLQCNCGLPHDCSDKYLYSCQCTFIRSCKDCAIKRIKRYDDKRYLQCSNNCIGNSKQLVPFILKEV